ncbi:hypothetical protein GGR77_000669 [Xanthomonas translucens]
MRAYTDDVLSVQFVGSEVLRFLGSRKGGWGIRGRWRWRRVPWVPWRRDRFIVLSRLQPRQKKARTGAALCAQIPDARFFELPNSRREAAAMFRAQSLRWLYRTGSNAMRASAAVAR